MQFPLRSAVILSISVPLSRKLHPLPTALASSFGGRVWKEDKAGSRLIYRVGESLANLLFAFSVDCFSVRARAICDE